MSELRIKALELAVSSLDRPQIDSTNKPASTSTIVERATAFVTFLSASTAIVAPTSSASPLAEADGTVAPRLDDPKVVAEAEAVIEHPTPSGTETVAPEPVSGPVETPPAASVTPNAPSATATSSVPPLAEVNAAVLAFNRANGREATLALLGKFGGSKVPEIDSARHADLLAELKAGTK